MFRWDAKDIIKAVRYASENPFTFPQWRKRSLLEPRYNVLYNNEYGELLEAIFSLTILDRKYDGVKFTLFGKFADSISSYLSESNLENADLLVDEVKKYPDIVTFIHVVAVGASLHLS